MLTSDVKYDCNQRIQYRAFIGSLRRDELNSLLVDLKNLGKDLVENVQLYPVCDTCFKGRREVGKPKRYELKEEKDKVAYFWRGCMAEGLCMHSVSFVYGDCVDP